MKPFAYGDKKIGEKELTFTVASIIIGGGFLTFPAGLAEQTIGSDGWIPIVIMGSAFSFLTWMIATLAARFPGQSFLEYTSTIVSKPVAIVLTSIYGIIFLMLSSYVVRSIGSSSKEYLLDRTPVEVTTLIFLLVVTYAVGSSRIGLIRINMLFLPPIVIIAILILIFNVQTFDVDNIRPVFKTDVGGYLAGFKAIIPSLIGFEIVLFYMSFVRQPKNAPKAATIGVIIPVVLYLLVFIMCIGVFGQVGTANMLNPTIDLAKRAEVPGMILGRSESIFFVIWLMAIFTSAAMTFDIAIIAVRSIFSKLKKTTVIFVLAPIYYFISMMPKNYIQLEQFGAFFSYTLLLFTIVITVLLLIVAKVRGVKGSE